MVFQYGRIIAELGMWDVEKRIRVFSPSKYINELKTKVPVPYSIL
jgi:hypothetical protein